MTTEQVLKFNIPRAVDNSFDLSILCGTYDRVNDSFDYVSKEFSDLSNGDVLVNRNYVGLSNSLIYDVNYLPAYGFQLGSFSSDSSLSIPDNSVIRLQLNNFVINYTGLSNEFNYFLPHDQAVPFKVYAEMYFTAMKVVGNTHSSTYHEQIVSLNNSFVPASSGSPAEWNIDAVIPVSADTSNLDESIDRLYNIKLRGIRLFVVFDWSSYYQWGPYSVSGEFYSLPDTLNLGSTGRNNFYFMNPNSENGILASRIYMNYETGSGSSVESSINSSTFSIQNSINNMGNSLTRNISQVKTQITQSTNTITTKIDTMSQDIHTGLQNVVESAQQNTQNIINTVTQKVDEVKTGITEVKDSILDLPNKISEMLIGLVVPDEQTMIEQRDNWDSLLAERFGAVYESVEVMDSIAAAFQSSAETSTITLPAVTVGLAGTDFTFGGYDVEVVPEGFDSLVTALKLIIDIVVTLAFINAMKLRYEQLVSR